ncbi:MAG: PD-(D/E)XK nuclease family protein [Ardenticatenaceae bacterium]|nr:PD-(D/E)XK nuclease family protein [Ardenticatenaceae bacterium]
MDNNVFSVLSRYAPRATENYLTEAFVFVVKMLLDRQSDAGLDIVNRLCDLSLDFTNPKTIVITTQRTSENGRPDIEIVEDNNTVVFVEVKHDSPLSPGQLESYLDTLQKRDVMNTRLVLLTRSRSASLGTTLASSEYHHVCWYDIYNWLAELEFQDEISGYFVEYFMDFLQKRG